MIVVVADGFEFHFEDALNAFVFDEKDKTKPMYHGAPMKCVDIVAEFANEYIYVELKDYDDQSGYDIKSAVNEEEIFLRRKSFKWLKNYLKYKFRDSYLYRHAEGKVEKPIHYICLITFDNALNTRLKKALHKELPVKKASRRWIQELAKSCHVLNLESWNRNFPKWQVTRLPHHP